MQRDDTIFVLLPADGRWEPVGYGFLVAYRMLVTCAHVVENARCGDLVNLAWYPKKEQRCTAVVTRDWYVWENIAVLQLQQQPIGASVAVLGPASGSQGHKCEVQAYDGDSRIRIFGAIGPLVTFPNRPGPLMEVETKERRFSWSGAPVWDNKTAQVVGMATRRNGLDMSKHYAIPTEMLAAHISLVRSLVFGPPVPAGQPPPSAPSRTHADLARLRYLLIESFTLEELHTLCFELRIDEDDIPGSTKEAFSREMLRHIQHMDELDALIALCKQHRPKKKWD